MYYAKRLLEQAAHLVARDVRGRPRQDNRRRAVSTAYYALFHFLIDTSVRELLGDDAELRSLRATLGRAFDHGTMRKTAVSFASGAIPAKLIPALNGTAIPAELREVASAFRELQIARHFADYDLRDFITRKEARRMIGVASHAITLWPRVRSTPAGRLFVVSLLAGDRIRE